MYCSVTHQKWCRGYRNGLNTIARGLGWTTASAAPFLLHFIINPIDMHFLNDDVDLVELEHVLSDMLLHYLRPANEWNISREHALYAIDNSEILMRLLRKMREFGMREEMI